MKLLLPAWSLQSQSFVLFHWCLDRWGDWAVLGLQSNDFLTEKSPTENVSIFSLCNTCLFAFYIRDFHSSEVVADMDFDLPLLNICLHVVLSDVVRSRSLNGKLYFDKIVCLTICCKRVHEEINWNDQVPACLRLLFHLTVKQYEKKMK